MKLLKIDEVTKMLGISKATLYASIQRGEIPPAIKITRRSRAWVEAEIIEYLESRPRAAGNDIKI